VGILGARVEILDKSWLDKLYYLFNQVKFLVGLEGADLLIEPLGL
jgi:hypothetical protein